MRTLFLIAPSSRKDRSDLRSNRDPEVTGVSVIGTVLANRYKISERIDAESFKAHDVLLDQTVTVRQTNLTSERAGDVWRQKVEQLALVRDSKFLNVIDVISEESRDFVITEASRGQTVADLLAERQRPDWENVLRLMTSLAQPLELAAAYSCCPKAISTGWLFTGIMSPLPVDLDLRSHPEWPMLSIQLDVWELVKPGKNNALPLLTANAWSGGSTALAVRQAALLTYELLGGEKKRDGQVKRWFKPLNDLGEAGNSILYSGLQGSSLFENSESFLEKLGSAIRSGEPERRGSPAPALAIRAKNVLMPDANDVMRKFNRETRWVSTAIVAALVFASFSVAVLIPERYPKVNDFSSRRAERDLFPSSNPMYHLTPVGLNQQSSTLKTMPGESNGALMEISPPPNTSSQADADVPNPGRILESPREMNREDARGNADTGTSAHRREVGGVAGSKVLRARSRPSARPRFVSVKTRLLELWHQMESEKSHSWAPVANSNKADQKKVSYTAETNH